MDIKAFKMDGLGNDFVIIDNREKITNLTKDQIVKICDRNFIGCDQLIFIESDSSADANLRFFNSDGGESGACGNGTRCVANLISNEKNNKLIILNTLSGKLKSEILDHQRMNRPGQKFYKVLAESALRAVRLCQPLKVPPTGYDKWKELQLNFNPTEMLKG